MSIDISLTTAAWIGINSNARARVEQWLVTEGSHVREGKVLAHTALDNTGFEFTAPESGVIEKILVPAGESFARGEPLAHLYTG